MKCPVGNNKANPHWPDNEIVLAGAMALDTDETAIIDGKQLGRGAAPKGYLLVAHNAAFDIAHALKADTYTQQELAALQLWDTQLAEYLLSGQQHKFPSLDECAKKRGGTIKDD